MKAPPVQEAVVESLGIERQLAFLLFHLPNIPSPILNKGRQGNQPQKTGFILGN